MQVFYKSKSLAQQHTAQHSVQLTVGSLRVFQAFSGFRFFLLPSLLPLRPTAGNANRWAADSIEHLVK
jgi:hypothetical protein